MGAAMFFGRSRELQDLEQHYATGKFQFLVLYGRRRVGKTSLISEFLKDKSSVFYSALDTTASFNRDRLAGQLLRHLGVAADIRFPDWTSLFDYLSDRIQSRRLILAIDEFPYIAQRDPSILSALQHVIDHSWKDTGLFLILCGSYVGFMVDDVLGAKSPLFGRRTMQIELKPFLHDGVKAFVPDYSSVDRAVVYGMLGGTPHYLNLLDPEVPLEENIRRLFLSSSAYLFDEPVLLLKQELREPAVYNTILSALANGASKRNDIRTRVGVDPDHVGKYLSTLVDLGLVDQTTSFDTKESARDTLYSLKDPLFRFWYRFIFPNRGLIELGQKETVLRDQILPFLSTYMGPIFEVICNEYVRLNNGTPKVGGAVYLKIGRWWGNDPSAKAQAEIDLVATSVDRALFAECKWTSEPFADSAYRKLEHRRSLVKEAQSLAPFLMLFSKSGFDDALLKKSAEDKNLALVSVDEMM